MDGSTSNRQFKKYKFFAAGRVPAGSFYGAPGRATNEKRFDPRYG